MSMSILLYTHRYTSIHSNTIEICPDTLGFYATLPASFAQSVLDFLKSDGNFAQASL